MFSSPFASKWQFIIVLKPNYSTWNLFSGAKLFSRLFVFTDDESSRPGLIISLLSAPTRATGGWIKNEKSTKSLTGSLERNYIHWAYTYFLHGKSCLIHLLCVSSLKMLHAGRKNTYTRRSKRGDSTPGRKVSLGLQRNHSSSNSFMWIAKCKLDDAGAYVRFDEQKTKLIVNYYKKFHFLNRHWGRNSFYFFH